VRKALFNFDIGRFFKQANLSGINPILPSKTGGVLRTIGSASKHLQYNEMRLDGVLLISPLDSPIRQGGSRETTLKE
jgi:hypothetical protein